MLPDRYGAGSGFGAGQGCAKAEDRSTGAFLRASRPDAKTMDSIGLSAGQAGVNPPSLIRCIAQPRKNIPHIFSLDAIFSLGEGVNGFKRSARFEEDRAWHGLKRLEAIHELAIPISDHSFREREWPRLFAAPAGLACGMLRFERKRNASECFGSAGGATKSLYMLWREPFTIKSGTGLAD